MTATESAPPLCQDCVLQRLRYGDCALEVLRVWPDASNDHEAVLALPDGEKFLAALALERPARCEALRALLPLPYRGGSNMHPLATCPEIGLMDQITGDIESD